MRTLCLLIVLLGGPLSIPGQVLTDAKVISDLQTAKPLHVYRKVRQLPKSFRENLRGALGQHELLIADPGEPFQTGSAAFIEEGQKPLPVRRLIFAAGNDATRLFYYESGGYGGGGATVLLFRCKLPSGCNLTWSGVEFTRRFAKDPQELIARILKKKVQEFDRR